MSTSNPNAPYYWRGDECVGISICREGIRDSFQVYSVEFANQIVDALNAHHRERLIGQAESSLIELEVRAHEVPKLVEHLRNEAKP